MPARQFVGPFFSLKSRSEQQGAPLPWGLRQGLVELTLHLFFFFQVFGSQQPYDPAEMLRSAAAFLSLSCVHGLSPGLCCDSEMKEALR